MNRKTYRALQGSISKWKRIVDGVGRDDGCYNCPLCHLFHSTVNETVMDDCVGCPVWEATGDVYCFATPHFNYCHTQTPEDLRHAEAELLFLKSLVPAGGPDD